MVNRDHREYLVLPLDVVEPDPEQPRKDINPEALQELANSIAAMGVEQPINVRKHPEKPGHYMIISGERRWRASQLAGQTTIPAILREEMDLDDKRRRQLTENYHRESFNPVEEAEFLQRWLDELKAKEIANPNTVVAEALGLSLPTLSKKLSVLKFDAEVRALVRDGLIRDNAALRALNKLPEKDRTLVIAKAKAGGFNFKDFQANERRVLRELRAEQRGEVPAKVVVNTTVARWHLNAAMIKKLFAETDYHDHVKEFDLDTVSEQTLAELFEKFKVWLEAR